MRKNQKREEEELEKRWGGIRKRKAGNQKREEKEVERVGGELENEGGRIRTGRRRN